MRARPVPRFSSQARLTTAAAVAMAFAPWAAHAVTYTVTTTTDGGAGSLRTAIFNANSNCASDPNPLIQFNITGTAPFVISSSTQLVFSCPAGPYSPILDGYSQPGASVNTLAAGWNAVTPVEVEKSSFAYGSFCGFSMDSFGYGGQLTIKGLVIRNFSASGDSAICGSGNVTAL